jgi:hypothetical protein
MAKNLERVAIEQAYQCHVRNRLLLYVLILQTNTRSSMLTIVKAIGRGDEEGIVVFTGLPPRTTTTGPHCIMHVIGERSISIAFTTDAWLYFF